MRENLYTAYSVDNKEGIDLSVYQCGQEVCQPGHAYGPAVRDHFLIHYVLAGQGIFQVGGQTYELRKHQGFLIYPDLVTYYRADVNTPWTYTWVGFNGLKAGLYLNAAGLTPAKPIFTVHESQRQEFISNCFAQMVKACTLRTNEIRLKGLLYLFLSELIEQAGVIPVATPGRGYIEKAIQYIERNYGRTIRVQDMANYVGLERSYFSNLFKQHTGTSPQAFLLGFRIDKACELMRNPSLLIGDIARSVGYEDPLGFSKIFRKVKGVAPRVYRRRLFA